MTRHIRPAPRPAFVLRGHAWEVQAIAFHPDGHLLYTGDSQGYCIVWSAHDWRQVQQQQQYGWLHAPQPYAPSTQSLYHRLHPPSAGVLGLACLVKQTATVLISHGRNGVVRKWVLDTNGHLERTHVLEVDTGSYNFCHISALYCPPCVAQPCVVDTCTTTAVAPEDTHSATDAPTCGHTMGVLYAEHEQLLCALSGPVRAAVDIWDMQTGTIRLQFGAAAPTHVAVIHHPSSSQEVEAPNSTKANAVEACGMAMCVRLLTNNTSGNARLVCVVGYEDGSLAVWCESSTTTPLTIVRVHEQPVMGMDAVVRDSTLCIVWGSADETLAFITSSATISTIQGTVQLPKPGIADVAFRPDGRVVFVAGWDGVVRAYQYSKRAPVAYLRYHSKGVTALALRPSASDTLLTASKDASVAVWKI